MHDMLLNVTVMGAKGFNNLDPYPKNATAADVPAQTANQIPT